MIKSYSKFMSFAYIIIKHWNYSVYDIHAVKNLPYDIQFQFLHVKISYSDNDKNTFEMIAVSQFNTFNLIGFDFAYLDILVSFFVFFDLNVDSIP